jgi:DNA recombination protein RmuC
MVLPGGLARDGKPQAMASPENPMTNILLACAVLSGVLSVCLLFFLLHRTGVVDWSPVLEAFEKAQERTERLVREEFARSRTETTYAAQRSREEIGSTLKGFGDTLHQQLTSLMQTNDRRLEGVREAVEERLKALQEDNAKQLEQMRATVDEKLQGTLEKRLGESFKLVSERLEQVYKGLGEMQTLATGVGDLKRVLTNVKTRGTWGEVQLSLLLEQVLTPEQYAANVATKGGSERVEFAIKLPGRGEDKEDVVWLPIDAKFPVEDYQRMVEAQEQGNAATAEVAARQLDARIRQCAKDISDKYLDPPHTTDFGILFLPTEGLFAEVIRRTGLPDQIQRDFRVVIAGPTTLWSLLNSLQMGFRTLTIQKRSSEVWNLLAAVKTEWTKYGEVLDKVQKQLHLATDTLERAQVRTRAIGRKLKGVQELPPDHAHALLALDEREEPAPEND